MESQSIKTTCIVVAFLSLFTSVWAQHPMTDQVIRNYEQTKEIEKSIDQMKLAVKQEGLDPMAHYTLGYLYKELYKKYPKNESANQAREQAMVAFDQALAHQPDTKLQENIYYAQRYIVSTYYNDALMKARSFQKGNEGAADASFDYFIAWNQKLSEPQPLRSLQVEFEKKKAERYYEFWEQSDSSLYYPHKCIELYQKILKEDPTDCESLHNIAILFYNIGVFKIKQIDNNAEIDELLTIQEEALRLFSQALPFAQNTFQECPKNASQYKALMYIQRSLGNEEEYLRLKLEAQNLYPNE
jgi:hypothetical protein